MQEPHCGDLLSHLLFLRRHWSHAGSCVEKPLPIVGCSVSVMMGYRLLGTVAKMGKID